VYQLTSISGMVSHVERLSNTSGSIGGASYRGTGGVSGTIRTDERTLFRIDNRPVSYPGSPSIAKEDNVTLIIRGRQETAVALRNNSTGFTYTIGVIIGVITDEDVKAILLKWAILTSPILFLAFVLQDLSLLLLLPLVGGVLFFQIRRKQEYRQAVYQLLDENSLS
jgi:hypothetical protein